MIYINELHEDSCGYGSMLFLKWVKKMALGKQCLKTRLSIRGCPSSSCLAIKYFQQYFKMVLHSKCGSGLNKEIHHLRTFSFPTYRALKRLHCFAIFWSTLPQKTKATADDQPALHKLLGLYTRTLGWLVHQWKCWTQTHFKYISFQCLHGFLVSVYMKGQSIFMQR